MVFKERKSEKMYSASDGRICLKWHPIIASFVQAGGRYLGALISLSVIIGRNFWLDGWVCQNEQECMCGHSFPGRVLMTAED